GGGGAADRLDVGLARRTAQRAQRRGQSALRLARGEADPAIAHVNSQVTHESYCTMGTETLRRDTQIPSPPTPLPVRGRGARGLQHRIPPCPLRERGIIAPSSPLHLRERGWG